MYLTHAKRRSQIARSIEAGSLMTHVFHRAPGSRLPTAVAGNGVWLCDSQGHQYLDASGGAAVSTLGHGHPRIIAAIQEQAGKLAFAHTGFFTNEPSEELAERLAARAPQIGAKVFFCSGGSEAIEAALKLARAYHVARGEPERTVFIARHQSYHGATLGALSVSGNPGRRAPYEAILPGCRFIAPYYPYRHQREGETQDAYVQRAADALEAEIVAAGPGRVAAFIAEPVVGATLGAAPAGPGYLARVADICRRHGVLFIADEVMCGMGRTGRLFACEADRVSPDIITLAKGLAGGYQPIGAVMAAGHVYQDVVTGAGRFEHGHTYVGHPIACAAALAVLSVIEDEGLLAQIQLLSPTFVDLLHTRLSGLGLVGDIRGRGFLLGVELVSDLRTKTPFPASLALAASIKSAAMREGLIVYPNSGCVDGVQGDHILIAPPYIATAVELDEIADRLSRALTLAFAAAA